VHFGRNHCPICERLQLILRTHRERQFHVDASEASGAVLAANSPMRIGPLFCAKQRFGAAMLAYLRRQHPKQIVVAISS
jgi:hypothetical protein